MAVTNKYHLTLEDADSGMSLSHKKSGYIEVGLSEQGVEFSLPVSFLETFVAAIGGTINIPDAVGKGMERVRLEPTTGDIQKIAFIKAVRAVVKDIGGDTPGLKETKELVESAMAGNKPEIFRGPTDQAASIVRKLRTDGWGCFSESV
jgi:ribosomal protein L7/L12